MGEHGKANAMGEDLKFALLLSGATLVLEVSGGLWSNSLALLGDAGHVFSDLLSIALAFAAFKLSQRPSTVRKTFGYHRAEVFASMANSALLTLIAMFICFNALYRLSGSAPVKPEGMIGIGLAGLAANILVVWKLKGHKNLNVQAAFFHALGDALSSIGVIAGGLLIALTGASFFDSLVSLGIAGILLAGAYKIARDSLAILFEWSPYGITAETVCREVCGVRGVLGAHDVHVWAVCSDIIYVTAHIVVKDKRVSQTHRISAELSKKLVAHNVSHTVFQFETAAYANKAHGAGMVCQLNH